MGGIVGGTGLASPHVVVAGDDPRQAGIMCWMLRERGYAATTAPLGDGLLDALESAMPRVLVLNARPDRRRAEEALQRVRATDGTRALAVIVAGIDDGADARALMQCGADDWLAAPLRAAELLARVSVRVELPALERGWRDAIQRKEEELARAHEDIATSRQLVEILNEVASEMSAAEIYKVLARRVARALDLRHCSVVLAVNGESAGTVVAAYDDPSITNLEVDIARYPELLMALRTSRPVLVADVATDPMFADVRELWRREGRTPPIRSVLVLPFALDRRRSGLFFLRTERGERMLAEEDTAFAETLIRAAVAAIRRAQALESTRADNRRLEELATTDALTRLLNRRALLERLSVEVDRARRFSSQLSLLMVDVDHFKEINDAHGHLAGDEILRRLGNLLAGAVRTIDVVARYGGEEFVVILPETSTEGAVTFAERLRKSVADEEFPLANGQRFHLTCSIGVATFPSARVASPEDLFARADEALYRAKSGGRNQVRS